MTVTIETGKGVRRANAYVPASFVLAYLTDLNRDAAWTAAGATVQDASVVAATDYIETRWGQRFRGRRQFSFEDVKAEGSIAFSGVPTATETLTVGDQTYTFVAVLADPAAYDEVLIGSDAAGSASNLLDALAADPDQEGVTYGAGTRQNRHVVPALTAAIVAVRAAAEGSSGDFTALVGPVTNVVLTALTGGDDGGSQPLSFPQLGLYDRAGNPVLGVPLKLRQATAEYAVRAASSALAPDPSMDDKVLEKVGPIETDNRPFVMGTAKSDLKPYPAADRLLLDYVMPAGGTTR